METGREMGRNRRMERNPGIGEERDEKNGEGKGCDGGDPGGEGRAVVMGDLEGRPVWAQGVGVVAGSGWSCPAAAVTSEPLDQLSSDVSPSSRPRRRWSTKDPPALGPQRNAESSRRGDSAARPASMKQVCEGGAWRGGGHCQACDHVCGGTACAEISGVSPGV